MSDSEDSELQSPIATDQTKITTMTNGIMKSKNSKPKTSDMVQRALVALKERKGSSIQAIKKFIETEYAVDIAKSAPFIKKYLKTAVETGTIIQTKGKGATGSFKLDAKSKAVMEKSQSTKLKPKKTVKKPTAKADVPKEKSSKTEKPKKLEKPTTAKKNEKKINISDKSKAIKKKSMEKITSRKSIGGKRVSVKKSSESQVKAKAKKIKVPEMAMNKEGKSLMKKINKMNANTPVKTKRLSIKLVRAPIMKPKTPMKKSINKKGKA